MKKVTGYRTLVTCSALLALAACSSGNPPSIPTTPPSPPPTPATYTIGGTVSGLTGSGTVTLSDTSAGSSGAIGNGAFTPERPDRRCELCGYRDSIERRDLHRDQRIRYGRLGERHVPAGNTLSTTGFFGTTVAVAEFISETTGTVFSAAVDVSQHVILPLNLSNTNVAPLL